MRQQAFLVLLAAGSSAIAAEEPTTLSEIHVQADADDFAARQAAPTTRLVYGREELDRMNELTVGDYLRRLPSVTFTGPPGSPKDVRLRGMDKGYTQILIDGEPVPGGKERQIQVDRLPLDMVERIEVIRAPSADMPNEGLAGTINIVLRDAPSRRVSSARLAAGRVFGAKTTKDTWNLSSQYGDGNGKLRWLLNASVGQRGELKTKSKSEESFNGAGVRTNWKDEFEDERTTSDGIDFSPRVNIALSPHDELVLTPFLSRTDEAKTKHVDKFKFNTPATDADYIADGSKDEEEDKLRETTRLRGEWKHKLAQGGKFSVYATGQRGGEDKDKAALEYNPAGVLTKTTLEDAEQDEREWFAGAKWSQPFGRHKPSAGIEFGDKVREDSKVTTENGTLKTPGRGDNFDINEQRWVIFAQDEINLVRGHALTLGMRSQHWDREAKDSGGQPFSGGFSANSPSAHYLWQIDGRNNLRASVTETLKPPKFDDLSPVTETKAGTLSDPDKSGNPDLQPEQAVGIELGWDHFLPRNGGVLGVNLFHRDIDNKIESRTELEDGRYVSRSYNVGQARVWGAELDARPRMDIIGLPELMLRLNYTRLFSELEDTATGLETRVKDQPPYVYNLGFDWQVPVWNAAWGVNYNYTPRFIKNPAETTKLDPEAEQQLLDMYIMRQLGRDVSLRLTASNLLDMRKDKDKYEFDASGVLTKKTVESERGGRSFLLALETRF